MANMPQMWRTDYQRRSASHARRQTTPVGTARTADSACLGFRRPQRVLSGIVLPFIAASSTRRTPRSLPSGRLASFALLEKGKLMVTSTCGGGARPKGDLRLVELKQKRRILLVEQGSALLEGVALGVQKLFRECAATPHHFRCETCLRIVPTRS